jgi:D-alanine transaminase
VIPDRTLPVSTAYLNGAFLPLDQAHVSVMDRGFLFGDGVYEVIPVYGGRLFRLAAHLKRLQNSLDAIRLGNPLTDADWKSMLERLVTLNNGRDQSVYLQVTRGVAPRRDHAFPENSRPTVFAMSTACLVSRDVENEPGVSAITLTDIRWQHCNVKAITLLPNILLRQQAIDANTAEAILLRDGYVIEGAASNVFIVADGVLKTPPNGAALLPGVTRDLVLELAQANSIPCREIDITVKELAGAEEIWLTSSTREISPVVRLDTRTIGDGKPGALWHRMIRLYQNYKDAVRQGVAA